MTLSLTNNEEIEKMKAVTTLNAMKQAFSILDELGLSGLLLGGEIKVDASKLIKQLVLEDKLVEFLQAITQDKETDFGKYGIKEAMELASSFFTEFGNALKELPGLLIKAKVD